MTGTGPNSRRFDRNQYGNRARSSRFTYMLDMSRMAYFLYDAKEVLRQSQVEQNVWDPMLSSVVAKASRMSISAAMDYIEEKKKAGILPEKTAYQLEGLLDRYKRNR